MESYNTPHSETLHDQLPPRLPGTLNVLTILTFIGCGLVLIGTLAALIMSQDYDAQHAALEKALDSAGSSGFARNMIESQLQSLEANRAYFMKLYQFRFIVYPIALLGAVLCLVGAIRMRKLRKSGFPLYVAGELVPPIAMGILVGFTGDGTWKTYASYLLPVVFVLLYATQRKYLVRD